MDKRKTWFLDFDGTLVFQKSYLAEKDKMLDSTMSFFKNFVKSDDCVIITTAREEQEHKDRIISFMKKNNLKCDLVICGIPTGPRILINDKKNDGTQTAYSINVARDQGINTEQLKDFL